MSKRRILIALGGVVLLAGCFYLLVSSLRQLPPNTVKPNAKPALAKPANAESSITVEAKPVKDAAVIIANSQTASSTPKPSDCGQTADGSSATNSTSARPQSLAAATSVLTSKKPVKTTIEVGEQLQNSLLNIASSLSQQIYQPNN